jgi:putative flavoprotein involved in K+ transport
MRTSVVIVGAGPGGLAMSRELTAAGVDHVLLERGDVGNSWRTERWDSLRLLTPNWMTALSGMQYEGDDPDGFMSAADVVRFLDAYRAHIDAPVQSGVAVEAAARVADGFDVHTSAGMWRADVVVAASGGSSEPRIPAVAAEIPSRVEQLSAIDYRRPEQLSAEGRVLVVGASASGAQIADELAAAGRDVVLAVGEHIRLPRRYRGRDIYWWLDQIGQLDERYDEVEDLTRARRHASIQVVGNDEGRDLDVNALRASGVQIVGRLMAMRGATAQFSGGLGALVANADLKQTRMLRRIDAFVEERGLGDQVDGATDALPTRIGELATELDLDAFSTVIWATGYRPQYKWLSRDAFDVRGRVKHDGGIGALPGLYFLGLPFLRRRRSNLLSGMGADAADLSAHMRRYLDDQAPVSARRVRSTMSSTGDSAPARRRSVARASPSF